MVPISGRSGLNVQCSLLAAFPPTPPVKNKDQTSCLENIKALAQQMWRGAIRCLPSLASPAVLGHFLDCGRRAHLLPADGLSLSPSAASRQRGEKKNPESPSQKNSKAESCRTCASLGFRGSFGVGRKAPSVDADQSRARDR